MIHRGCVLQVMDGGIEPDERGDGKPEREGRVPVCMVVLHRQHVRTYIQL